MAWPLGGGCSGDLMLHVQSWCIAGSDLVSAHMAVGTVHVVTG